MFHALIATAWCLCSIVHALHADDQTRLSEPIENPKTPSLEFLHNLQAPDTLLLVENTQAAEDTATSLHSLLEKSGHTITRVNLHDSNQLQLKTDSAWKFDTIVLISNTLPKSNSSKPSLVEQLLSFIDTLWTLPTSVLNKPHGLRLPPSLIIFSDGACSTLHNETTSACGTQECTASVNSEILQLMRGIGFDPSNRHHCQTSDASSLLSDAQSDAIRYEGGSHFLATRNERLVPMLKPQVEMPIARQKVGLGHAVALHEYTLLSLMEESLVESLISAYQGERTWSRVILSSSLSLCSDEANHRFCKSIIDWATHRRDVVTWSDLRHWRLHEKYEWSEYEGDLIRESWTTEELNDLKMTRPYLYRIRDEVIVGLDLWQLKSDDGTHFEWEPLREPWIKFEYNMMETYVRKLLLPAVSKITYPTNLMSAVQQNNFTSLGEMKFNAATHWIHYKAPKQHGIFKIVLKSIGQFHRTPVWIESLMPLRTYKHDEDPRFVASAFPYYSSVISSSLLFAAMGLIFPLLPAGRQHIKAQ